MKQVEGVYGNSISLDYRRKKLPMKVAEFVSHRVLDILFLGSFMVIGAVIALNYQ
jgi:hypothetical protein